MEHVGVRIVVTPCIHRSGGVYAIQFYAQCDDEIIKVLVELQAVRCLDSEQFATGFMWRYQRI